MKNNALPSMHGVSLAEQISCVKREIAMRAACYPKWVASGRMKQQNADTQLEQMRAVRTTLESLKSESEVEHA